MTNLFTLQALCMPGGEKPLSNELKKLAGRAGVPFNISGSFFGRVRFSTTLYGVYLALMGLRTSERVLLELASFNAPDFETLFENAAKIEAENFITPEFSVVVEKVRTRASALVSQKTVQSVTQKALSQRLCSKFGMTRLAENSSRVFCTRVYIENDTAYILLDLSGEALFKRGWRQGSGAAPLRETAAAAMLLFAGWRRKHALFDPFCGAGTIVLESLLFACNIAPGMRRSFALDNFLIASPALRRQAADFFESEINLENEFSVTGSDKDSAAISAAKANLENIVRLYLGGRLNKGRGDFYKRIVLNVQDFANARHSADSGFIITNPPYGNRLDDEETAKKNYREMSVFRRHFTSWHLALLASCPDFESLFGAKADKKIVLRRGAADLFLYQYESLKEESQSSPMTEPKTRRRQRECTERSASPLKLNYTW